MGFRVLETSKKPYDEQGLVYFTLRCYWRLPQKERDKVDGKIRRVCRAHKNLQWECYEIALKRWLCGGWSIDRCVAQLRVREATMRKLRVELYDLW